MSLTVFASGNLGQIVLENHHSHVILSLMLAVFQARLDKLAPILGIQDLLSALGSLTVEIPSFLIDAMTSAMAFVLELSFTFELNIFVLSFTYLLEFSGCHF